MRSAILLLLVLAALAALAGCGDSDTASEETVTSTSAAQTTTATAPATKIAPRTAAGTDNKTGRDRNSPFVVVTSLLGKPLPKEPLCRFAKTFAADNPSAVTYDGALSLTVTCDRQDGYTGMGQIVNRAGSKPTEITCRDTTAGQLFCVYVPSTSVGLYFTGTDRAVVRRRLEHLIEVVAPLPRGVTPLSGTSVP
jgi:hypothetical protein